MRVGVVGLGSVGRRHVGNLLALGCEVFGYDPDPAAHARAAMEGPALDTPLVGGIDAVVIASPLTTHLEWVEWAIASGLPFFVEKPLGSLDQLPAWRRLAARDDLPVNQVGYQCRFHPDMAALRQFVSAPTAGGFYCDCDMRTWPGTAYGPALLECSHDLDLALYCGVSPDVKAVDRDEHELRIWMGDDRWLVSICDHAASYLRVWSLDDGRRSMSRTFRSPDELGDRMYLDELAHFITCVRMNQPTLCPLADGLRVLDVCQQVEALCASSV